MLSDVPSAPRFLVEVFSFVVHAEFEVGILQSIFISQTTDFHFVSFHFVSQTTVSLKIERVDKIHPLHSNMLFGKILSFSNKYATVVTQFDWIKGTISASRLYPCTALNMTFDNSKEITFTAACKFAIAQ